MKDDWFKSDFAKNWDDTSNVGNPTRMQQLELLAQIVKNIYKPGTKLIDLGFGSGQVEEVLFQEIPELNFIGVDSSDAMIKLAEQRLKGHEYEVINHELTEISSLKLPNSNISVALSIQALHELTHEQKQSVFKFVYNLLPDEGYYLIVDRFTISPKQEQAYTPIWNYFEGTTQTKSGKTFGEYAKSLLTKEDFTATSEQHINWLKAAGFDATIVYLALNRGIIVGRK